MASPIATIDWSRPWLAPYREHGTAVAAAVAEGTSLVDALNARGPVVRFVPQAELPRGEAYEAFIARTGCVPTRANLHDLFNALAWLTHPLLKRRMNALQSAAIAADGVGPVRGALRDALTQFDETGALLDVPASIRAAIAEREWLHAFVGLRREWAQARVLVIGHALLEQLAQAPRKGLTAFACSVDPLAADAAQWAAKPFVPLPLLGIPGWWPANEEPGFYADPTVFRRPKALHAEGPT